MFFILEGTELNTKQMQKRARSKPFDLGFENSDCGLKFWQSTNPQSQILNPKSKGAFLHFGHFLSQLRAFYIICLSAAGIFAQSSPSTIIENSLQAIGGQKEIAKVRNIQAIADCTGPKRKYTTEIYSAKDWRLIFKQTFENGDFYLGQTNGQTLWTKDEKSSDFELADKNAAFAWRAHDFQWLAMEVGERFRDLTLVGEEVFNGKTAVKLHGKDELGSPADVFFDKETKLMLGSTVQNPFTNQPEPIRTVINEWKQTGRLKLPSKVTVTDKQGDFVLNFKEILLNKLDEKIFAVPPKVIAMNELLELHKQGRVAHFSRDAKMLVSGFADDFTEISNGKIRKPSREASLNRFQNYLNNSTFLEWDDITPPVIKVSDDASMAYVLVHKKVRLLTKNENGKEEEETEIFAWIAVYQKIKGEWKLTAVVSTNTPEKD